MEGGKLKAHQHTVYEGMERKGEGQYYGSAVGRGGLQIRLTSYFVTYYPRFFLIVISHTQRRESGRAFRITETFTQSLTYP